MKQKISLTLSSKLSDRITSNLYKKYSNVIKKGSLSNHLIVKKIVRKTIAIRIRIKIIK
jgi:hypothetical protein